MAPPFLFALRRSAIPLPKCFRSNGCSPLVMAAVIVRVVLVLSARLVGLEEDEDGGSSALVVGLQELGEAASRRRWGEVLQLLEG